ncbi:MAG: hypothetical protein MUF34_37170 [Polyangiaceae bacterium]|jgi:hypothetical protein|nr:hypothetical protein [Polyangiaceae bacterium]
MTKTYVQVVSDVSFEPPFRHSIRVMGWYTRAALQNAGHEVEAVALDPPLDIDALLPYGLARSLTDVDSPPDRTVVRLVTDRLLMRSRPRANAHSKGIVVFHGLAHAPPESLGGVDIDGYLVNSQWSQRILMSLLLWPRFSGMPALYRGQPLVGVQHLPAPCVSFFGIRRRFPVLTEL